MSSRYEKEENGEGKREGGQTMEPEKKQEGRTEEGFLLLRRIGLWTRSRETEGEALVGCDACRVVSNQLPVHPDSESESF